MNNKYLLLTFFRKDDIIVSVNGNPVETHRDTVNSLKNAGLQAILVSDFLVIISSITFILALIMVHKISPNV